MSRALVALAERGIQAEAEARQQLKATYRDFVNEADPARKNEAGRDLIKAIFGKDSIAGRFSFLIFRAASGNIYFKESMKDASPSTIC